MSQTDGTYFWDMEDEEWKNLGNIIGVKGDKGDTGNTPNITATGSVTEDGGNPSVTVTKTGTIDNPNLEFNFKNFKGAKGDTGPASTVPGPAGADGQPGVTPNVTATASVSATTGTPDVTVTKTGTTENPVLNFAFSGLKGERGPQGVPGQDSYVPGPAGRDGVDGTDGVTPTITASATVDNTSSTNPTVSVVKTGTDENPNFAFNFHGLKGLTGDTGPASTVPGPAGRNGNKIFSGDYQITETSGGMGTVTVDSTMANDMNVGDFFISTTSQGLGGTVLSKNGTTINLQKIVSIRGPKGDPGADSTVPGPQGSTGVTPNISATASINNSTGTPSVTVTRTGSDAQPNLNFNFQNLKGSKGDAGVTPNITATASVSSTTGTPAVTVTKSGTATNPNFNFSFNGLKGEKGDTGSTGPASTVPGPTGPAGPAGPGIATGGSTGQVLVKASSSNYDTEWETIQKLPNPENYNYWDVLTVLSVGPNQKGYVPHHFKELPDTPTSPSGTYVLKANAGYDAFWDRDTDIHVKYWQAGPTSSLGSHTTSVSSIVPSGATIRYVMSNVFVSGAGNYTGLFPGYSNEGGTTGQLGSAYISPIVSYSSENRSISYNFIPVMRQILDGTTNPNLVWSYATSANVSMPSVYVQFMIFYSFT